MMKVSFANVLLCVIFQICLRESDSAKAKWTNYMYCGQVHPHFGLIPLVYGGSVISRGTWPWMVAIYIKGENGYKFKCGGTLVSGRQILTAAHCLYKNYERVPKEDVKVILGQYSLSNKYESGSQEINIAYIKIHPHFSPISVNFDADIAVIISVSKIRFTEYIQPACLTSGAGIKLTGKEAAVVGWGIDESGKISDMPKLFATKIISKKTCIASHRLFNKVNAARNFCAGKLDNTSVCSGDSGSGLLIYNHDRWYLRGIVSFTRQHSRSNICHSNAYVVYTDVSRFLEWINNIRHRTRCIIKKGHRIPKICKQHYIV